MEKGKKKGSGENFGKNFENQKNVKKKEGPGQKKIKKKKKD